MSTVLVRRSVTRVGGRRDYQDAEVSVDEISIGSGPRNTLQILDATLDPSHATISVSTGKATLRVAGSKRVSVNGVPVASKRLQVGDRLEFGSHTIQVIEAPSGFALALLLEQTGPAREPTWEQRFVTSLQGAGLRKRRTSWLLAAVVVIVCIAVPMAASLTRKAGLLGTAAPIPDRLWASGALSGAHELVAGGDCLSCHQLPFRQVRDTACLECHEGVQSHVRERLTPGGKCSAAKLSVSEQCAASAWMTMHDLQTDRCGSCHREHNEPSTLVNRSSGECVECHGVTPALQRLSDPLTVVNGFSPDAHPRFEVTLPVAEKDLLGADLQFVTETLGKAVEKSNLKFSHVEHLDAEKVRNAGGGGVLECADCHEPDGIGEHFKPVTMLGHCERCHELTFDEDEPLRRLPHGNATEAVRVMREHFLRKYVQPASRSADKPKPRPLPDHVPKTVSCTASALACAQSDFDRVFGEQLRQEDGGCAKCHQVVDSQASEPEDRYAVRLVHLAADFMPAEHFPHDQHLILSDAAGGQDRKGDSACLTCHAALKSSVSRDVLMPDATVCFDCHRDESVNSRVSLSCADCHGYHPGSGRSPLPTVARSDST